MQQKMIVLSLNLALNKQEGRIVGVSISHDADFDSEVKRARGHSSEQKKHRFKH